MLVTNDERVWRRAWSIKDHGKSHEAVFGTEHPPGFSWLHETFGTNMRMTEMQAAIGLAQLGKLAAWVERRNANAGQISETLAHYPSIRVPCPPAGVGHAYYRLYAFVVEDRLANGWSRDRMLAAFIERGIPGMSGSCPEIYREKAFDSSNMRPKPRLPNAHRLGETSLAFHVHPTLTGEDLDRVCRVIDEVMRCATK